MQKFKRVRGTCKDIENLCNGENFNRGAIWYADLGEAIGSEQSGRKMIMVIQNNIGNKFSPTVIVSIITSRKKTNIPTHVEADLFYKSTIMCEQIKTLDKKRLHRFVGNLTPEKIVEINNALKISLDIA